MHGGMPGSKDHIAGWGGLVQDSPVCPGVIGSGNCCLPAVLQHSSWLLPCFKADQQGQVR